MSRFLKRLPAFFRSIFEKKITADTHQPDLDALYAFRTIITMLSLIRSEKETPKEQVKHGSKELKIVDALAAVIIREHGVAAVAAVAPDNSGAIQVFTSVSFLVAQIRAEWKEGIRRHHQQTHTLSIQPKRPPNTLNAIPHPLSYLTLFLHMIGECSQ